ncbi:hypothetical protein BC937DRAFT_94905, partial [Endogone sp. FLAS-F59071]
DLVSWTDYALDVLQVIDHFDLKRSATHLVGVGHSLGACAVVVAEQKRPGTFMALVANDPVITTPAVWRGIEEQKKFPLAVASLKRRDRWPTRCMRLTTSTINSCISLRQHREVARELFFKNKFYQTWDPEMLNIYVNDGLRLVPDSATGKEVMLKCLKVQEYATFTCDQKTCLKCKLLYTLCSASNPRSIHLSTACFLRAVHNAARLRSLKVPGIWWSWRNRKRLPGRLNASFIIKSFSLPYLYKIPLRSCDNNIFALGQ